MQTILMPLLLLDMFDRFFSIIVQADVNGLKWIRYVGPTSVNLEAPKDDPVLNSYAKLLNEG